MNAKTERFEMRLDQDVIEKVDQWRVRQSELPSRSEAVRRLLVSALDFSSQPQISDGDRLIIAMLRDIIKSTKVKGEIDSGFVMEALYGGHLWALEWEYVGLFHNHVDSRETLSEVVDVLDMWTFIERAHAKFNANEKAALNSEHVFLDFPGFDQNYEGEHINVARFLIDQLNRFSAFKGRDINSHHPSLEGYRRMLRKFLDIRPKLVGREMTVSEVREIFSDR